MRDYCDFVNFTASDYVRDDELFKCKAKELSDSLQGNFARMDNAVNGIAGEAGEIDDLWKKIKFHGKEFNDDVKNEIINEIGDMFWYLAQASIALGVPLEEIIKMNIEKLKKRHPDGFSGDYMTK